MSTQARARGGKVLVSSALLSLVLGSVHGFSVFLEPLEAAFGASRRNISLIYSGALVAITLAVLSGPRIFGAMSGRLIFTCAGVLGVFGLMFASSATQLWQIALGYSLLFGFANGIGYGFGLQFAALANPGREGFAMGVVTAAYGVGAAIAPFGFARAVEEGGFPAAIDGLAIVLAIAAIAAVVLVLKESNLRLTLHDKIEQTISAPVTVLWLGYFSGVAAGLMAIGHAAGIARAAGMDVLWPAVTVAAILNMLGAWAGGVFTDRLRPLSLLVSPALLTGAGVLMLIAGEVLIGLGLVGFGYGATIAIYPAVIAKEFGMDQSARIYGRVFTAWGTAGLAAPWVAGLVFDQTGGYGSALMLAFAFSLLAVAVGLLLGRRISFSAVSG